MIVVYNPYAGDKLAEEYVSSHVKPALESAGRGCELVRTEYEGHAHEISTKLAQRSVDLEICLIGGDSTTHEFLGGLSSAHTQLKIKLVIIPLGTANALYHSLHSQSHLDRQSLEYRLLAFNSYISNSDKLKQLPVSEVVVDGQTRRLGHVVISTAVHAALLHRSEELRSVDTSVERFKTAFMEVCTRWTEGAVKLENSRKYSNGSFSAQPEDITLKGPFTYLLASHIDRLEDKFVIAPHSGTTDRLSVVVVRPTRDARVREQLDKQEHDAARQMAAKVLTDVMYAAYDNGKHVDMQYDDGEYVVEYFSTQAMSFQAGNEGNYVCVDGGLVELNDNYVVSNSDLNICVQI